MLSQRWALWLAALHSIGISGKKEFANRDAGMPRLYLQ